MNAVSINRLANGYVGSAKKQNTVKKTEHKELPVNESGSRIPKENSVVTDFIRRNPETKSRVMEMVKAGESVRKTWGAQSVDTQNMSMSEYQAYISNLLGKIPFAPSRPYDEETVFISQEGWEQMKNDPEYEAWVLGYTKVNRSVPDPFFGMGSAGSFAVEHFGASIEEHNGHGYSKLYGGSASAARSMFQAESGGGMTYRASKNRDIAKKLEEKRVEEERRKKKRLQKERQEHMRLMQQWTKQLTMQGHQVHDVQTDRQTALSFYETGFLFET